MTFPPSRSTTSLDKIVPGPELMSPTRRKKPELEIKVDKAWRDSLSRDETSPTPRSPDLLMPPSTPKEPLSTPRTSLYNDYKDDLARSWKETRSTHKIIKALCVEAVFKYAPSCITDQVKCSPNHCPKLEKTNLQKLRKNVKCVANTAGCCAVLPCAAAAIASCGLTLRGEDCCYPKKTRRIAPE